MAVEMTNFVYPFKDTFKLKAPPFGLLKELAELGEYTLWGLNSNRKPWEPKIGIR
jgi:hypothetical protein